MKTSIVININNNNYKVNVIRKDIKNMYLRIKKDLNIYITCNYLCNDKNILKFIKQNEKSIIKMIENQKRRNEKDNYFILLGEKYEIVICEDFKIPVFNENKVYVRNEKILDKYLRKEATNIFNDRLEINFNKFEEKLKYPELVIKNMKAKWGYYSKSKNLVCLNLNLIKYNIDDIDYVIIHELCHMVHFNHSKGFWNLVRYYKSDYKVNRKNLKE